MKYTNTEDYIKAIRVVSNNKLYIAGAGKYGVILGRYFDKYKIHWEGYVDKKSELYQVNEKPVFSYDEIKEGYYVVSSYSHRKEIESELVQRGVTSEHILVSESREIVYDIYNALSDWGKNTKKIEKFYNYHNNERCFVIGNGPSLTIHDLEKLNEEITFASNSIYALYNYTNWRPTYYCAADTIFCKQIMTNKEDILMLMDGCKAAFTTIMSEAFQFREDAVMDRLYYYRRKCDETKPEFSKDCSEQIYTAGTITYEMLQLAVYMGIKQIYLLGIDFSFSVERRNNVFVKNDVCNHIKEIEEEEEKRVSNAIFEQYGVTYFADTDWQLAGYQKAKQYADAHGIKIYNATRGGKLEVFPRVDFDSLFD